MVEQKFELLEWFIAFIQADLESIEDTYKSKLITEALSIVLRERRFNDFRSSAGLMPISEYKNFNIELETTRWKSESVLEKLQEMLKENYDRLYGEIEKIKKFSGSFDLSKMQNYFHLYQAELTTKIILEIPPISFQEINISDENVLTGYVDKKSILNAKVHLRYSYPNIMNMLLFYFIKCFENLPLMAMHKCPNCRKIFISLRQNKIYCTGICANKYTSKMYRERIKNNNPEKYENDKRQSRIRARKSYEKKITRGKPARRPRLDND